MKLKKILPIVCGLGAVGLAFGAVSNIQTLHATTADEWSTIKNPTATNTPTVTNVEGGVTFDNLNYWANRAYKNEKVHVDGLTFTISTTGMSLGQGDARGFYLHSYSSGSQFFDSQPCVTFTYWTYVAGTQMRLLCASDHNHGLDTGQGGFHNISYSDTSKTHKGLAADDDGTLVQNSTDGSVTNTFVFTKYDANWWRVEILGSQIWGDVNYNATSGVRAYTFISNDDMKVDANGDAYLCVFGLATHDKTTSSAITLTNLGSVYQTQAESWGAKFLEDTDTPCTSGDPKTALSAIWDTQASTYSALPDQTKSIIKAATASETGTNLEKALARYERIVSLHSLNNFIGRTVQNVNNLSIISSNDFAIIGITLGATIIAALGLIVVAKKRKSLTK